jgi:FkbM family methyltransferase
MPEPAANSPHPLSSPLLDTRDREAILARLFDDRPPQVVFDCGACVGGFTAAYLALFPQATIHAFEPHPHSADHLRKRFRGMPRVVVEQAAVGAAAGVAGFDMHRLPYTSSLLPRPATGRRYFPLMDGVEDRVDVPVTTLDDYCHRRAIERIDILKMDIQGAELTALRGAESLLREQRIDAIFTEAFFVPHYDGGCLLHDLWGHLAARGYGLYTLFPSREGRNGQLRLGDAIFISQALRAAVVDRIPDEP